MNLHDGTSPDRMGYHGMMVLNQGQSYQQQASTSPVSKGFQGRANPNHLLLLGIIVLYTEWIMESSIFHGQIFFSVQ
jgi:hypothetical protein